VAKDCVLSNGLVVTPNGVIQGGVEVEGGKIVGISADSTLGQANRRIDLQGKIVFPGVFDPHIHFGLGDKIGEDSLLADFDKATRDCLIGGVTTIATTTLLGHEPLPRLFEQALRCGTGHSWCDFKLTSVVNTRDQIGQIEAVTKTGGISFKFFTGYVGAQAEGFGMSAEGISPGFFYESCRAIRRAGRPAFPMIHAEDPYVRGLLVDELRRSGRKDYLVAWAETSPDWAESLQIYSYGLIARELGCSIYPVHLSAAESIDTVKHLQAQGFPIVAETVSYFLCTTAQEMDAKGMGGKGKIQPPIRFAKDRERLWRGIKEGTVTVVGTDSLTYSASFKETVDFWDCRVGVNLQVADSLPLIFDEAINHRGVDLVTLAKVMSENAARMYGIFPKKGAITLGADADMVVIDPDKVVTLGTARYRSGSDYSLWEGRKVRGIPVMTFLRGQLVAQDGEIVANRPTGAHVTASLRA
jgi:dihydropyrimidinase